MSQKVVNFLDDLGISLVCRPINYIHKFGFLNFMDDMGIHLVIRPLGYLNSVSAFLMGKRERDELTSDWV
jgi:hypothetical protein